MAARSLPGGEPVEDIRLGSRSSITKAVVLFALVCLLLAAPSLAHGAQMLRPSVLGSSDGLSASGGGNQVLFMPQDRCVQSPVAVGAPAGQQGCQPLGSAAFVTGNLTNHGGPVMHSATNYAIFWLPPGYHFDTPTIDPPYPNASDANYEALLGQYFRDLSNTAFYSILQQYGDRSGAPGLAVGLGGSWADTSPYPNSEGTKANPLQDSDIQAEVARAIGANGWSPGSGNNEFFVFTGQNVFSCAGSGCSYKDYCAYHSAFQASDGQDVVYANIPDPGNANAGSCLATAATGSSAPNGAAFADSAVNLVAHEEFEAVTDPVFNGWYFQDQSHEIADECAWKFGPVAGDGSNVLLNGHSYLVQEMWSNKVGGCYLPQTSSSLVVVPSYQVLGGGSGFAPPKLNYYSAGVLKSTSLSTAPQTLSVDLGSEWNVTATLQGSTTAERWQLGQAATGVFKSGGTLALTYYHQYFVNFEFGVLGGGSGFAAPSITLIQFGNQASTKASSAAGQGTWVDAQSTYSYTGQLPGSGANERWAAPSAGGTVPSGGVVVSQYYHQYLVPVSYSGGGVSTPTFSYSSLGLTVNASLASQPQSFWVDSGASYSATNPLHGSTATERWFATAGAGTVSSASALLLAYNHQFFVSVQGGTAPSAWFNSGSQATVTTPGVYSRSLGAGMRVTGYQTDGGALQAVAPTIGPVSVILQMDGPHIVSFASVAQYQVSLDPSSSAALLSITSPTIPGDPQWFDSGSTVTLALNGVWGRDSSSGSRLASYSMDGGVQQGVATAGPVTVMQALPMTSPHSVAAVVTAQYKLSTQGGSIQSSTPPSIEGDPGWYDSGTKVSLVYGYVWNQTQGARMNALGITIDGAQGQLARSGTGTFQEAVVMSAPHVLDVLPVVQYQLTVSGGSGVTAAPQSPTGDGFYDSGSSVAVSSERTWDVAALSRDALISYSIDGGSVTLDPVDGSATFSTPSIAFDRPHQVVLSSATQYLVGIHFTDALGKRTVVPTSLQIGTSEPNQTFAVQGSNAWVDAGSTFVIKQLLWENADVTPISQAGRVDAPQNFSIAARVYDATLRVSDYLGLPISGAAASIQLANHTSIMRNTSPEGTITMASIPLGRFNATVSYLGASQRVSSDVSSGSSQVGLKLPASLPDFGALAGVVALVILAAYLVVTRRHSSQPGPILGPTRPASSTPPSRA